MLSSIIYTIQSISNRQYHFITYGTKPYFSCFSCFCVLYYLEYGFFYNVYGHWVYGCFL